MWEGLCQYFKWTTEMVLGQIDYRNGVGTSVTQWLVKCDTWKRNCAVLVRQC